MKTGIGTLDGVKENDMYKTSVEFARTTGMSSSYPIGNSGVKMMFVMLRRIINEENED